MKELEVNEYVRMKDGIIGKVKKIEGITNKTIELDNGYYYFVGDEKTHSKNLIDLVEEGDYVNGHKIVQIWEKDTKRSEFWATDYLDEDGILQERMLFTKLELNYFINPNKIETILTHEQYENNCYKVRSE